MRINTEEASAGGLAGLFLVFVVSAIVIILVAPVVDWINFTNNAMIGSPGLPMSQDRLTTMNLLCMVAFPSMAIMILLAAGINYWTECIRDQSGEV
ncbi:MULTISPECIES: hypothetical protein [unclassified Methanoregula]|uniref:hypothetical protein n=1 Tax=unclassified Methanoregula TaxID=2649730 RepID=UPI0009CA13E4|nr:MULTISPECIES: hypothetical protein [unclassified Methanoregula]OPX64739.1 MAG: hypothetical protein A4E33_00709 [Methanoregula sp. PtaB.Bin085]OPY35209.1 MAG: hypothetical protein A4E34_00886 [Methanoregula sp. PtaU1.Bin006]